MHTILGFAVVSFAILLALGFHYANNTVSTNKYPSIIRGAKNRPT
jgi:hypothetical protein